MTLPVLRPGVPGLIPDAWIVAPDTAPAGPPVVIVHGIQRQAREMATLLKDRAAATGRTLVLPVFDTRSWRRYQRALCRDRSDLALLRLLRALRSEGRIGPDPVDLSGFSGGAQFAHRFAWLYPEIVGRLCLAAPGWWTFPDRAAAWPYGMAAPATGARPATGALAASLPRFLNRDIVVCVGDQDTERDANFRAGPEIDAQQGLTRVERARNWCDAMRAAGRSAGSTPRVSFARLPGCGHSFSDCVIDAGLDRHFVAPPPSPAAHHGHGTERNAA